MGICGNSIIYMEKGGYKKLVDIKIGDEVLDSGKVISIIQLEPSITKLYKYSYNKILPLICSGSQIVKEKDKWIRVYDSNYSCEYIDNNISLYQVITTTGFMLVNFIKVRDFLEHRNKKLHNISSVLSQLELNK